MKDTQLFYLDCHAQRQLEELGCHPHETSVLITGDGKEMKYTTDPIHVPETGDRICIGGNWYRASCVELVSGPLKPAFSVVSLDVARD